MYRFCRCHCARDAALKAGQNGGTLDFFSGERDLLRMITKVASLLGSWAVLLGAWQASAADLEISIPIQFTHKTSIRPRHPSARNSFSWRMPTVRISAT